MFTIPSHDWFMALFYPHYFRDGFLFLMFLVSKGLNLEPQTWPRSVSPRVSSPW